MAYYKYYVYTLAYPDGRIFYVGKGQGDRMHQHEKEARRYHYPQMAHYFPEEGDKIRVILEIWASGGQVVKTKVFETDNEEEANEHEKLFIAQCDPRTLTNRTKGGGPLFSKRDPYARLKHRELYYSPKEAFEKLNISDQVWHRLFLSGVLHFYQVEGCTRPVLDRKEIDDFALRIKNGTYPIDAWEMAAPNVWKAKTPPKRSLWWDDEPASQQAERPHLMSKLDMLREAATTALNAAQQASSEPCFLIGSYERKNYQSEQDELAWEVFIKAGQKQYIYIVIWNQDQFIISDPPIKPPLQPEKQAESSGLSESSASPHNYETIPSGSQPAPEDNWFEQPGIPAVSQSTVDDLVTTTEAPRLAIDQVKKKWETILQRLKLRKDGKKVAALLRGYDIVAVDNSTDLPIIILKAKSLFHYHAIQKGGYQPDIEWVLKVELEQECRLLLLSQDASLQ
jgi:hypothetical protein